MEIISALLAICAGIHRSQRPVTRSFGVFFDLRLNKRLSKQSWGWWFDTSSRPLGHRCNVKVPIHTQLYSWLIQELVVKRIQCSVFDVINSLLQWLYAYTHSKVHGPNMGPTWFLPAPGGPHVGLMNFAIWVKLFHTPYKPNIFKQSPYLP